MAEETKQTTSETTPVAAAVSETTPVVVTDKLETPAVVVEKDLPPQPEPEPVVVEKEADEKEAVAAEPEAVKEDPEKKALDEFKAFIQEALNTHQFTTPPTPPPKEEPKKEEETVVVEKEESKSEEPKTEPCEPVAETTAPAAVEPTKEEVVPPLAPAVVVEKVEVAAAAVVTEDIKETIVHEVTPTTSTTTEVEPSCEGEKVVVEAELETTPIVPEEISIWGIPLLADERSDVVLLKFLQARDFKVKEAFAMLKSVVAWRKEFKIDELLDEVIEIEGLEKVVFMNGVDKEGHPVCYNCFGEFQDKDLYKNCIADAEKRGKFLRWYIQLLEKNVRGLDFSPEGNGCTIVQITDLKNSPGFILFKKELRQATDQALQLLQDNYPEFVAKQLFINVPWWYVAYNRMISPFLTLRTKSKFVFAGPTKTAETLFKYIAPEQVPVQYGGLNKEGESEFASSDAGSEEVIKPACKHTVEFPVTEAGILIWEARVIGWDVSYGAEFVPSEEGAYTLIVQKARKIGPADELSINCTFKTPGPGKVVLTFDNQTSKKKKLLYRSKAL